MLKRSKIGAISSKVKGNVLHLEQVFPASPDVVFKAFTDEDILKEWWGPNGWGLSHCTVSLEPGGAWHYCLTCLEENSEAHGQESWGKAIYTAIDAPKQVVFRDCISDAEGHIDDALTEPIVTLNFNEKAKFTKVQSTIEYSSQEELDSLVKMGLVIGITQTWNKLDQFLRQQK